MPRDRRPRERAPARARFGAQNDHSSLGPRLSILSIVGASCRAGPPAEPPPLITRELANDEELAKAIREYYTKYEYRIPMRDGTRLFTAVYAPKDHSHSYPILLLRTPYGVGPYGTDNFPTAHDPRSLQSLAPAPRS